MSQDLCLHEQTNAYLKGLESGNLFLYLLSRLLLYKDTAFPECVQGVLFRQQPSRKSQCPDPRLSPIQKGDEFSIFINNPGWYSVISAQAD